MCNAIASKEFKFVCSYIIIHKKLYILHGRTNGAMYISMKLQERIRILKH